MTAPFDYGMFTDEGNNAVHRAVEEAIGRDVPTTPDAVCQQAYDLGHREAFDTVVREAVYLRLERNDLLAPIDYTKDNQR